MDSNTLTKTEGTSKIETRKAQDRDTTTSSTETHESELKHWTYLSQLQILAKLLPKNLRQPLIWIVGTLLILQILLPLVDKVNQRVAATAEEASRSPGGMVVTGFFLLLVIIAGVVDRRNHARLRTIEASEHERLKSIALAGQRKQQELYNRRLESVTATSSEAAKGDLELFMQDSVIAERIQKEERASGRKGSANINSRIIAVISGKGGVGKSLLSLGLVEEFSREQPTLLVDFDLHNRGLTSLLFDTFPEPEPQFVINLLRDFLNEEKLAELLKEYATAAETQRSDEKTDRIAKLFRELRLKYSGTDPHRDDCAIRALGFDRIPQLSVKLHNPLNSSNAFFLPSIPLGGSFLGSRKVRDASEDAAFLFFKALSYRIRVANGIQNMIVDCHGAHDLYTVGLIRAATDLVIVTTPDMGAIEGTRELIRFGQQVTNAGGNNIPRSVLVVNRCLRDDPNADELIKLWKGDLTGGIVRITSNDDVERISRNYQFGSVAAQEPFWNHVERIRTCLD